MSESIVVAIVGGSGFIGTRLCDRFSKRDDIKFKILDIQKSKKYSEFWVYCDIKSQANLLEQLMGYDVVINLAAEHKDNVFPPKKYYDTNVVGQNNLSVVMDTLKIKRLIFTSSVAVYGFVEQDTDESGKINPFHEYGDSKYQAEIESEKWFSGEKQLSVIRPTVVFGEENRGNVYNLLRQIASGKFLMIGKGENKKSMAYVENVAAFIEHLIDYGHGHQIFNYVDKPDFSMNNLVKTVNEALDRKTIPLRIPFFLGLIGGYIFDFFRWVSRKELPISSIRVRKFCAKTQFKTNTDYIKFKAPVSLEDGLKKTVRNEF